VDEYMGGNHGSQPGRETSSLRSSTFDMPTTHGAPACEVCGRRDETLRAIVIPYVFSVIVMTMRRTWVGVYCWRHRLLRLGAAGLISALFGWWGIPWGFIYTPVALFKLAKGGDIPEDENVELLARVAVHKLNTSEPGEAIRVFQEALRIKEDERTRRSLVELQARYPLSYEPSDGRTPFWYIASLMAASLIGIGVGLLDYLVVSLLGWILGEEPYLILALLSWAPLVAMLFLGILLLNELLRRVLDQTGTDHLLIGMLLAIGTAGLMWYGIPQGHLIGEYLGAMLGGMAIDSLGDFIMTTGAVISQGGLWFILDALESGLPGDWIYLGLWGLAGIMYFWLAIRNAQESVHWRVRLELLRGDLQQEQPKSRLPAWGALGGFAFVLLFGFVIFAGRGRLLRGGPDLVAYVERGDEFFLAGDYEQAESAYRQAINAAPKQPEPHDNLAWVLYSKGDHEGAEAEFTLAKALDPNWADPHIGMAYVYLSRGDRLSAGDSFQTALALASDPYSAAQAYYGLGNLAHQADDLEAAIAYYEQAVREDWQLALAHMDMALAYYAMGDFSRTIEHGNDLIGLSPDWGATHALLALAHYQLDQPEIMTRELDWADDLDSADLYSQLLLADVYWALEQYQEARVVLESAYTLAPENIQVPLQLARLYAVGGEYEKAQDLVTAQVELDPSLVDAYLARAWVYIEMQDLGQAEAALNMALKLAPDDWSAHNLRSFVYFHLGRIDEAFNEADTAIRSYPYEGSAYTHRAFAARARGDIEGAFTDAQHALELAPKLDMAHFILGVVYLDRGEVDLGAESLRVFLELARDRAFVRDYIQQAQAVLSQLP
jgi:tetratricopeptide (TPR) repeat protein